MQLVFIMYTSMHDCVNGTINLSQYESWHFLDVTCETKKKQVLLNATCAEFKLFNKKVKLPIQKRKKRKKPFFTMHISCTWRIRRLSTYKVERIGATMYLLQRSTLRNWVYTGDRGTTKISARRKNKIRMKKKIIRKKQFVTR